jgi:hypothetical protein
VNDDARVALLIVGILAGALALMTAGTWVVGGIGAALIILGFGIFMLVFVATSL